jgi:mono/diheme cytochrome c family protein
MGQVCSEERSTKRRLGGNGLVALGVASALSIACSFGEISDESPVPDDPGAMDPGTTDPEPAPSTDPTGEQPVDPLEGTGSKPPPEEPVSPQEALALAVLATNCGTCHGSAGQGGISYIEDKDKLIANGKIVKGDPASSPIFNLMAEQAMPPRGVSQRPSAADIEIVRQWIEGLLEAPPCTHDGDFVSFDQVYATMAEDILAQNAADRPFIRYFGIVNAYNAGACGAALDREKYALFKTVNSLSTEPRVTQPRAIDSREILFRIDLRDYGWERAVEVQPGDTVVEVINGEVTIQNSDPSPPIPFDDAWEAILNFSAPYAVEFTGQDADVVKAQANTLVPFLQVDGFIAAATTQNLYYALIDAPDTLTALFVQLGIDQADQLERNLAIRAGFSTSGVSEQERSVMRFDLNQPGGFFWASFDFADNGQQNASIYADPLGSDAAAAGGEFIFSLPNGMMAFYVAANNGVGSRLTEAPTDVVTDPRQVKNNNAVSNGVSCNGCHQNGIFPFEDKVREYVIENQLIYDRDTFESVMDAYRPNDELGKVVAADSQYFESSLKASGVPTEINDPVTTLYLNFVAGQVQTERAAGDLGVPLALLEREMSRLDPRLRNVVNEGVDRELFEVVYQDTLCILQAPAQNRPANCQ